MFGQRKYLAYIAQLMLVNNPTLVENAADMIRIITENNEAAIAELGQLGEWKLDERNPNFAPNDLGTLNSILVVEEKK